MKRISVCFTAMVLGLFFGVASAKCLTIVGWDAERGGQSSLACAAEYEETRDAIEKIFPKTTFVSVEILTGETLEKADVVWIGMVYADDAAVTPLSAEEQAALLAFIKRGGAALLFADNDSFDPSAAKANASILEPVKAKVEGTAYDAQNLKIESPDKPPFKGTAGQVNGLSGGYTGWFDVLPKNAKTLATLDTGKAMAAVLPAGSIEKNSGSVWLFANSGSAGFGGAVGGEWSVLFANILSTIAEAEKK